MNYATSKQLIKNTANFLSLHYYGVFERLFHKKGIFYGWGRKRSGREAVRLAKKYHTSFVLLEDGFIRSVGLGVDGADSFSLVQDTLGIYYDATTPSKLENILNTYQFHTNKTLMHKAEYAIRLIQEHHISKYNNAPDIAEDFFQADEKEKVLIIAQTAGDSSLEYGMLQNISTNTILNDALQENPNATIYLKIHPDVLCGKKKSDIDIQHLDPRINLIQENINPISLLKHMKKVYTKTSGMGFEALLVGCEVICYGNPFYSGWGVTHDKVELKRRKRQRSVSEIFAAAYILYSDYINPFTKEKIDICAAIELLAQQKKENRL